MYSKMSWNIEMNNTIWYQKYQPKTLDEFIFGDDKDKALFTKFIKNQDIPNLLISGIQGTGKSSMVAILMNELLINNFDIKIMSGTTVGVDKVRTNIDSFCKILSRSKFKVIIIEEADEMSSQAQKAFRMVMDNNKDNARFIFTSNYPDKIIPALHSRVQHIHINELDYQDIIERIAFIIDEEQIEVDDIEDLYSHVEEYEPDMRKIINSVQQFSVSGTLSPIGNTTLGSEGFDDWVRLWTGDTAPDMNDVIKLIPLLDLGNPTPYYVVLYNFIKETTKGLDETAIITVAEYMNRIPTMACQELNLHACVLGIYNG